MSASARALLDTARQADLRGDTVYAVEVDTCASDNIASPELQPNGLLGRARASSNRRTSWRARAVAARAARGTSLASAGREKHAFRQRLRLGSREKTRRLFHARRALLDRGRSRRDGPLFRDAVAVRPWCRRPTRPWRSSLRTSARAPARARARPPPRSFRCSGAKNGSATPRSVQPPNSFFSSQGLLQHHRLSAPDGGPLRLARLGVVRRPAGRAWPPAAARSNSAPTRRLLMLVRAALRAARSLAVLELTLHHFDVVLQFALDGERVLSDASRPAAPCMRAPP